MSVHRTCLAAMIAAVMSVSAMSASVARAEQVSFDLVLMGLTAGRLTYDGSINGGSYAVSGRLQTTGLAALLKQVRYDATAKGRVAKGVFTPEAYTEDANTGKRQSRSVMGYRRGVPQVTEYQPARAPRSTDVDPATQGGTVDPLTALFATLADVAPGQECRTKLRLFDGRRASQLTTGGRKQSGDTVTCTGEYRRVAGFSADEMADRVSFPFTLTYSPQANGTMRVTEVAMQTIYGRGWLVRR